MLSHQHCSGAGEAGRPFDHLKLRPTHLGIQKGRCKLLAAGVPHQRIWKLPLSFPSSFSALRPSRAVGLHLQGRTLCNAS